MNYLSPETVTFSILLFAIGCCSGWWLRRQSSKSLERQALRESQLPAAQVLVLEDRLSAASASTHDYASQCAAKDINAAKWQQRYKVARKEIEERIKIMDEVESDNIELDSALCKSIVEQEKLQMLLCQRNERLEVMNSDRAAQESRLLAIKEELDLANRRIQELESELQAEAGVPVSSNDEQNSMLTAPQQLEHSEQLELLNRELVGKDRILEQLRQELRGKASQLDELQLELTCLSTLAKADGVAWQEVPNGVGGGILIDDDSVLVQAPSNLFSVAPRQVDKLQQIQGIGAKLEHSLNELGIYQFRQIVEFTATDLLWLDQQLGAFKGCISRDNWVGQAETLSLEQVDE